MRFKLSNAFSFGWEGIRGFAYNSKEDFSRASAAYFEVTGSHGKVRNEKSDRVYLVLEGKGEFIVDGVREEVGKNDVIIVPKNTAYNYQALDGVLKLFLVHTPAFDAGADVRLG